MRNWLLAFGYWLLAASTKHKVLTLFAKLPEASGQEPEAKSIKFRILNHQISTK